MQTKRILPLVFISWGLYSLLDDGNNYPVIFHDDWHIERQNEDQVDSLTTLPSGSMRITDSTSDFDIKVKWM
jgi:hypothetical protein